MSLLAANAPSWLLLVSLVLMLPVLALVPGAYLWDRMHGREPDDGPVVWREEDEPDFRQDTVMKAATVNRSASNSDQS